MTPGSTAEPFPGRRPGLPLRLGAVLAGTLLVWLAMGWLSTNVFDALPDPGTHIANAVFVSMLAVPMVIAARRYLDQRSWSGLRLTGLRAGWWPLLVGAVAWLAPAAAGTTVAVAAGWVQVTVRATATELILAVLLLLVLVFVFEALPEELVFRGYVYRNLNAVMAAWQAVAGQAILFMLFGTALWVTTEGWGVVAERAPLFLVMAVVIGVIRVLTGNLWACIGYHLAFQVVAQLLLGSRYADIQIQREETFTLVAFGAAFALGPMVVGLLPARGDRSPTPWRAREPDPDAGSPMNGGRLHHSGSVPDA